MTPQKRRVMSALLRQLLVDVPKKWAVEIAHPIGDARDEWPLVLDNPRVYRKTTGLAHVLVEDSADNGTLIA
jgi:hypothetical protein